MSHIPNSAMPHAGPAAEPDVQRGFGAIISDRAGRLAETARAHPRTAAAAGAAVLAGAVAAATIPLVRGRTAKPEAKAKSGRSKKAS
jgi:hypothetical protein